LTNAERAFNVLAGLSVLSWAVLGMTATEVDSRLTPARIALVLINTVVGVLFLVRKPLLRQASLGSILLSLPALVALGLAFKLAPPLNQWPVWANALFLGGAGIVLTAFVYLGRCFAVLPAARGTVDRGPYRVVRHPAYTGELLMVLGCFLAGPRPVTALLLLAALPCVVVRLLMEEMVLKQQDSYRRYAARVRWRLLPRVW
jgi:protein-S-isoprenylcysteine O-methyltransferase Ste14